tara:strand:+ start:486 stop:764 length:279 start_codon:yes stop_codon:yes gene_type:complete
MSLKTYLKRNNFSKKELTILFSVGCVLNTSNGDTFPLMDDATIDFSEGSKVNIVTDDLGIDWWKRLETWNIDREIVEGTHLKVLQNHIKKGR